VQSTTDGFRSRTDVTIRAAREEGGQKKV